jgi:hypothetical protein
MVSLLIIAGMLLILIFGGVLLVGAPYLPTLKKQSETALKLLDLQPGETLLELGCGDGRVLKVGAKQGLRGIGYELNPILFLIAKLNTWRVRKQVRIIFGDYWAKDWPEAQGIFVFLHPRFMARLDRKIKDYARPCKVASYAFKIPAKQSVATDGALYLYRY